MLKWFSSIDRWGRWAILVLAVLFILTGYGKVKGFMPPETAKMIHEDILPIPFFLLLFAHIFLPVHGLIQKWRPFDREVFTVVYTLAILGTVLLLFLWLHWR